MQIQPPTHLIDMREQVATLERLSLAALKDAGYDTREATFQALIAGKLALERELRTQETAAAVLARSQALLGEAT